MNTTATLKRYARALVEVASEEDAVGAFGEDLGKLVDAFAVSPDLYRVLLNPMFKIEQRLALAEALSTKMGVTEQVGRFLGLLVSAGIVGELESVSMAYSEMEDEIVGRLRVTVEIPTGVEPGDLDSLKESIAKQSSMEVVLTVHDNPSLLGGIVVRIGNTIIDGSLKTQLKRVGRKMLQ